MELQEIDTLRALLPAGRTVYSYFKDKYSLQLLRYAVRRPTPVAELRRQPVARLLEKPAVREVLARCGGQLAPAQLELACGHPSPQHYTRASPGPWPPWSCGTGRPSAPPGITSAISNSRGGVTAICWIPPAASRPTIPRR